MKILFLIGSLEGGGAERQLRYLASALAAHGDRITIALLNRSAATPELTGVSVVALRTAGTAWLTALRHFRSLARSHDVVYSMMDAANVFSATALRGLAITQVWGLRSTGFATGLVNRACARGGTLLAPAVQLAICNAPAVSAFYSGLGYRPGRWAVVPNAVDTNEFRPAEPRVTSDTCTVVMLARADPIKRHDLYIELAQRLQTQSPQTTWLIAGAGTDATDGPVAAALRRVQPDAAVQVCGPVADVASLLRRCDLLVSCSDYEGSSNVLLEALASAVPAVSFAVGDASEILSGCGVVVEPASPEKLAEAVSGLLRDAGARQRLGAEGRRKMLAHYSVAAMTAATRRLLEQASDGSSGAAG